MAKLGCKIIIGARDRKKNEATIKEISTKIPNSHLIEKKLDLGDK